MRRSFDSLAPVYETLERISFGDTLVRARRHGLSAMDATKPQRVLLLGDGDGRFALELLAKQPYATVDSLDLSRAMLRIARHRLNSTSPDIASRFHSIHCDCRNYAFPKSEYDVVVSQFFLDCFSTPVANQILICMVESLKPRGLLVFADFSIPDWNRTARLGSQLIVKALYIFFRIFAKIEASELPRLEWPETLKLESRTLMRGGLVTSEIRTKTT